MSNETKKYDLEDRLVDFAVSVVGIIEALPATKAGTHIGNQLVRSGTSPAANYREAQGAESRRDFIHKMKVALKELRESRVWLRVILKSRLLTDKEGAGSVMAESEELLRILVASIRTAEGRVKTGCEKPRD